MGWWNASFLHHGENIEQRTWIVNHPGSNEMLLEEWQAFKAACGDLEVVLACVEDEKGVPITSESSLNLGILTVNLASILQDDFATLGEWLAGPDAPSELRDAHWLMPPGVGNRQPVSVRELSAVSAGGRLDYWRGLYSFEANQLRRIGHAADVAALHILHMDARRAGGCAPMRNSGPESNVSRDGRRRFNPTRGRRGGSA